MSTRIIISISVLAFLAIVPASYAQESQAPSDSWLEIVSHQDQVSSARLEPAELDGQKGIAVMFKGTDDLHYYASAATAPAPGYELKIKAESPALAFDKPVFPQSQAYKDPTGIRAEVYQGSFTVFVPISKAELTTENKPVDISVKITGLACTSKLCLPPFEKNLKISFDPNRDDVYKSIDFKKADPLSALLSYPIWYALGLALLAGLSLNIMPCVWPVLPLVVLRIVEQAKNNKGKKITMGLAFCLGITLFFACLAAANITLQLTVGTALQWGDQFRNPVFVTVMALVLIVLALFMFDVFAIIVPASVSGKSSSGSGYAGTVGMGFLAAILSTPCSFGLLAAAFAWAQGQPLVPATIAILFIGLGMGIPYVILTAIPGLLERLPKPGKWMDIFKRFVGFVLLAVAVWMITVVPQARRTGVLYFAVVLSFCIWMWGGWVGFGSKLHNKIIVRLLAVALAVAAGFYLLRAPVKLIDWQDYGIERIENELKQGKPVLVKFTADWCLSCKTVDKLVYSRKDVADLLKEKEILAVKADTTLADYPATSDLATIYKEPGVPVSILLFPDGKDIRWHGKTFAGELIEQLNKLPSKKD